MGTAPTPDLANDLAFIHEVNFMIKVMVNGYLLDTRNNIEPSQVFFYRTAVKLIDLSVTQ